MTNEPIRVLFVCTGNSARSILAEATLRHVGGTAFEASSAGTHPAGVHPLTDQVLLESGISRLGLRSKSIDEVAEAHFDYVVTLCDDARALCPVFPGADQSLHWGYTDPSTVVGTDEEQLEAFRRVFSQIGERIRQFVLLSSRTSPAGVG